MRTCIKQKAFTLSLVIAEGGRKTAILEFTTPRDYRGDLGQEGHEMKIRMSMDQLQELADVTREGADWRELE